MSGFQLSRTAQTLLLNPAKIALIVVFVGSGGGFAAWLFFGQNLFERFGSVLVAFGVLIFGIVAAELLNRAQDGYIAREEDEPTNPTSVSNIRRTLNYQAAVVFAGTLQWGFGSLLFGDV